MKKIIAFIVIIAILLSLSGCDPVPTTYHVLYSGNENTSGSIPVDTTEYQSGDVVIVLGNIGGLIRPGYVFAGWNTATDGSGTSYAASDTFNMGSLDVTLYAMWIANPTFTVTYDGNGSTSGTVPNDGANHETGEPVTVLDNPGGLTRSGYSFAGWNTATDGSGTSYAASDTFNMGSMGVTLYAMWTEQTWIEHTSGYQCAELVYTSIQDAINHLMANNVIVLDTATAQYIVLTVCGAPNSLFYQALIYIDDLNKAFDIGWTAVK